MPAAGQTIRALDMRRMAESTNAETVEIAANDGLVDLGVVVPILIGTTGTIEVSQHISWSADTTADTRGCELDTYWEGGTTGSAEFRMRSRSVTLRQASGVHEGIHWGMAGFPPGELVTFRQRASISTDDLSVLFNRLQIFTY